MKRMITAILACGMLCATIFLGSCAPPPEQAADNILTVYMPDYSRKNFKEAFEEFRKRYPDMKMEFAWHDEREERKKVSAEIMAGTGPDVLLLANYGTVADVNKSINAGAFSNLEPYIKDDDELSRADFYEPLLTPCEKDGKLFALPITFSMPMLITTQEILDKYNIRLKQGDNLNKINAEIAAFGARSTDKSVGIIGTFGDTLYHARYSFVDWLMPLRYQDSSVQMDKESYRIACDAFKAMSAQATMYNVWDSQISEAALLDDKVVFDTISSNSHGMLVEVLALLNGKATPVVLPISPAGNGYAARIEMSAVVNANSDSKTAAYDLVKLMTLQERNESTGWENYAVRSVNEACLASRKTVFDAGYIRKYIPEFASDNPKITPPDAAMYDNLLSICENIDGNSTYFLTDNNDTIFEKFKPYIDGKSDFDACFETALSTAEIYISE